ncbi:hypothetical protein C8F01DRAFT_984147 [Mycena amicta]|nr:hypothetical protein C8F01DRAFT_984147 [Mycena amicta]
MLCKHGPILPAELEREISQLAALSYPRMLPTLLLVARRFTEWLEPLLYHVVPVDHTPAAYAFMRAIQSKPPSFLQHAVRRVYLDSCWEQVEVVRALRLCTGVEDLAVTANYTATPLLGILYEMRLRRFSGYLVSVFGGVDKIDLRHPLFASLTHLDLYDDSEQRLADRPDGPGGANDRQLRHLLTTLPSLTHLALNHSVSPSVLEWLLASLPNIHILVVLWHLNLRDFAVEYGMELYTAAPAVVRDTRFVMVVYEDVRAEWEAGAWGSSNFWVRAGDFVRRRRTGELDNTACLCFERILLKKL